MSNLLYLQFSHRDLLKIFYGFRAGIQGDKQTQSLDMDQIIALETKESLASLDYY